MKAFQMGKRVMLFLAVNVLIMITLSIVFSIVTRFFHLPPRIRGFNYSTLMVFCLVWGMGGAFISLALSRMMAKWFMGVQVIDPRTSDPNLRDLVHTVHSLAQRAGLPEMPQVGFYESPEVNAFATGPTKSRSLVAVSTGLLNAMNREQVEGVLGHEIAHIANGDMVTMTLLQGVVNAFAMFLARIIVFAINQASRSRDDDNRGGGYFMQYLLIHVFETVFLLLGSIVVSWFSRWREFRADAGGARYAGQGNMVGALRALQRFQDRAVVDDRGSSLQTLKISSPPSRFLKLFMSHPPLEQRIARLEKSSLGTIDKST
ncbi:MAG: Protease HtpX [Verrucomicrobiales bacterium]|nr:Protease HtpX [Verrucomicrobiales bacterium]